MIIKELEKRSKEITKKIQIFEVNVADIRNELNELYTELAQVERALKLNQ